MTTIGKEAFLSCSGLKSLTLPDSVTRIEDSAFQLCTNLKTLEPKFLAFKLLTESINSFILGLITVLSLSKPFILNFVYICSIEFVQNHNLLFCHSPRQHGRRAFKRLFCGGC